MGRSLVRSSVGWLAAGLSAALVACGGEDPVGPVATNQVEVRDNRFSPINIRVAPSTTVTWTWVSTAETHNVNFASASITDGPDQSSGTYSTTMPSAPGTYTYACTNHVGMTGSVQVQ